MRWLRRSSTERGDMPGHCLRWGAMNVIAYTSEGVCVEAASIALAMAEWLGRCTHVTPDARGQVRGLNNYMYVCVRELPPSPATGCVPATGGMYLTRRNVV